MLQMVELNPEQAHWVWRAFAREVGPEVLKRAYAWDEAPPTPRPLERVFAFSSPDVQPCIGLPWIGWGSVTKNPLCEEWWHSAGVFPQYQRQGYRLPMRNLLVEHCFKELGAQLVTRTILNSNLDYQLRCLKERQDGGIWRLCGEVWSPEPGYAIFSITNEEWSAAKMAGHPEAALP